MESKKKQLEKEIEALEFAIKSTDTHAYDLIIAEIKREMETNIAEEDWKTLKQNQKNIEAFYSVEKIIESQSDLLERKQEELDDIQYNLDHYQRTLDDAAKDLEEGGAISNGIELNNGDELITGDVYKTVLEDKETGETIEKYYLIKKSAEYSDKFAILSSHIEGELLLNYPANIKLINDATHYVGNIYNNSADSEAIECLKIIAEFQTQVNMIEERGEKGSADAETCETTSE